MKLDQLSQVTRTISANIFLLASAAWLHGAAGVLFNGGFEEVPPTNGWECHIYGAIPQITADPDILREGRQSLRISASSASDTGLGQELQLPPGAWYRFSGWIRTRDLDPADAPVYATLQVQHPGGKGILATGANHRGDTDWAEVEAAFRVPGDGLVRLCAFFVGFGKGTGTAWFDSLSLTPLDITAARIRILPAPPGAARIHPFQYGQFIEYLCDLVPALWAEKLYDGGFEGLSPYKFVFNKETDFKEKPWRPSGAVNRTLYSADREVKVSGQQGQRIQSTGSTPCTVGISQDGIAVSPAQPCQFTAWFKARDLTSPVRVRLHHEATEYASTEFTPSADWKKFSARLKSRGQNANATLSIEYRGPGTLWVDAASLMPLDSIGGWRRDAVQAIRDLNPGIIRFGGSAVDEPSFGDFEWKDTIGPVEGRKPLRAWGGLQPPAAGLEEFVQLCKVVQAEPLICVRVSGREPRQAADQVEYFNGPADSPMGRLRARNGRSQPYAIRFWQVGNERGGEEYESRLADFCEAMKKADPGIKLLSSFPSKTLLQKAGKWLDYVSPHHYTPDLGWCEGDLDRLRILLTGQASPHPIKVAVTEWNTTAGDWGLGRGKLWTLENALACARYHHLLHRQADLVEIANRSNLANSFCSGIIQTDNCRLYRTPTYYAQQLYASLAGPVPLRVESSLPRNVGLDLSATSSPDGNRVVIFAVNDSPDEIARTMDLSSLALKRPRLTIWTLADKRHAGEPDVTNSFAEPERIAPVVSRHSNNKPVFRHNFPPFSITVLEWKAR